MSLNDEVEQELDEHTWLVKMSELEMKHGGILSVGGLIYTIEKMMAAEQASTFERDFPPVQDPRQRNNKELSTRISLEEV